MVGERDANNTLYLASDELIINGKPTGLPGASAFEHYRPDRVLTAPEGPKSRWAIPDWLMRSAALMPHRRVSAVSLRVRLTVEPFKKP